MSEPLCNHSVCTARMQKLQDLAPFFQTFPGGACVGPPSRVQVWASCKQILVRLKTTIAWTLLSETLRTAKAFRQLQLASQKFGTVTYTSMTCSPQYSEASENPHANPTRSPGLNRQHPSIRFTVETEWEGKLPSAYLDVRIIATLRPAVAPVQHSVSIKVYREPILTVFVPPFWQCKKFSGNGELRESFYRHRGREDPEEERVMDNGRRAKTE